MVITWHREREYSSGAVKIFLTLIQFSSFFIVSSKELSGHFWQLTDLHWDQQYSTDGDPGGMCHSNDDWINKLSTTKSQTPDYMSAGQYGTYSCDAPWDLIEFSIKGMAEHEEVPDFIIWTGDNTPHVKNPMPDWPVVFSSLQNVSTTIRHNFPNTTLIPVLGNHDVYPGDLYPSEAESFYRAYLTEGGWNKLLDEEAQDSFRKCGFYHMIVKELKVIVLNTNLYNVPNNLTWGEDDPCGQLTWFEQQLQLAQSKNIRVIVAAHIPPGYFERWIGPPFFNSGQNDRYVQLIHRYGDVILTHVYGHTHTDSFRIFADNSTDARSVAFVSPSVTPWLHEGGVNPSLRLYHYASEGIKDYWQYYFNLTGSDRRTHPKWQLLYQATKAYGVTDLSPTNMLAIYREMMVDPTVFDRYYFHNTVGHVFQECDAVCVRDHICTISHLKAEDMTTCQQGKHVLFHNDPVMAPHFANINHRARLVKNDSSILVSFLAVLTIVCGLAGFLIFVQYRKASRNQDTGRPRHSDYTNINNEEA